MESELKVEEKMEVQECKSLPSNSLLAVRGKSLVIKCGIKDVHDLDLFCVLTPIQAASETKTFKVTAVENYGTLQGEHGFAETDFPTQAFDALTSGIKA